MQITYHGHACFGIQTDTANLLIDPFLTGNAMADVTPEQVSPDYILVSHAHGDHLGDALPIARRTGATVISNYEIANYMGKHGVKAHAMHIGGAHVFPFGKVKLTIAHHGSSFPDGGYGGNPCGFLLWLEGKLLYFAGDTALTCDMTLYGAEGIDVAMLPIGDNFTMGPEDAVKAVGFLQPKTAILMHYDTFPVIAQDAQAVAAEVKAKTKAEPVILKPGETLVVA
ncbi:MAG: metal-dependent hydrolase [Chloroflexi bacterium HGW-Chloroflexi-1]|nr:MAG: metal-dependent hydrolase [Chloroflexi bacterium HGW-Chloroflexi-1]